MKTSLVVSTYNWCGALSLCLKSVLNQSVLPDEIVIADDGSTNETKELVRLFSQESPVPVIHVWHEDKGFRKTIILNKAIAQCSNEYIIQIDGDIVLHKHFVKDHIRFAQKHMFVCGSRVKIKADLTKELLSRNNISAFRWRNGMENFFNGIHLPVLSPFFRDLYSERVLYVRGCNMAFWREDCLCVNGYNEEIQGWGREDSEFCARLVNLGVRKCFLKFSGIAFHLSHTKYVSNMKVNNLITQKIIVEKMKWCDVGISQYLPKKDSI